MFILFLLIITALTSIAPDAVPVGRFYTVADAQKILGLSKPTVLRLTYSGQLASAKVGRRRLIVRESLDALADSITAGEDITTKH
jgi:excisionase family DNA binding protein